MDTRTSADTREDLTGLHETCDRIRAEVRKVLVGQDEAVDLLLTALIAEGHVLLEGVPGIAKTLSAKLLARVVSVPFQRIQFTPDLMPSDILGTSVFDPSTTRFEFRQGPIFSGFILIDEVNRAPAKTQAALFEAMEERQVTIDGATYAMQRPFLIVATQNPIEHEGTYRLPEAQLDRFLMKVLIDYPSESDELAILQGHHEGRTPDNLDVVSPVLSGEDVLALQAQVKRLHIELPILTYIAAIARATRRHPSIMYGASPRAAVGLMNAAKAMAALSGRDFVTPEDVQDIALPVLRHRIIITPDEEIEGRTPDDAIRRILSQVEVPR
jgi:MoxR-like ATPase